MSMLLLGYHSCFPSLTSVESISDTFYFSEFNSSPKHPQRVVTPSFGPPREGSLKPRIHLSPPWGMSLGLSPMLGTEDAKKCSTTELLLQPFLFFEIVTLSSSGRPQIYYPPVSESHLDDTNNTL